MNKIKLQRNPVKQVDLEMLKFWRSHRFHGDIDKIAKETGIGRSTISKALNTGYCSEPFTVKINNYFKNK